MVRSKDKLQPGAPPQMRWYVVHTYSGFENKVRKSMEERIKLDGMEDHFGEILIPTEQVVEMVRGSKRTTKRKFFPGYILVQMIMDDRSWHLVKSTAKVTGFVGGANTMEPDKVPWVTEEEVSRLTNQMSEGTLKAKPKVQYESGDNVRVIDGPFSNFNGSVEEVDVAKGRLKVLVSIFGRSTPVELEFMQVEKA